MGGRWPKQAEARHTSQMDRLRMRGEELAVEAPARAKAFRTRRRDGLTTTAAAAMAAGRCWMELPFSQHVLRSLHATVTYDESEHCAPYTYEPGLIAMLLEAVLETAHTPHLPLPAVLTRYSNIQ
jgi:hypothetical protein